MSKQTKRHNRLRTMRIVKRPYLRNRRLILGNEKKRKTDLILERLILENGKTQIGGFLSAAAALALFVAAVVNKIFGGGKKRHTKRIVNKRPQRLPRISC